MEGGGQKTGIIVTIGSVGICAPLRSPLAQPWRRIGPKYRCPEQLLSVRALTAHQAAVLALGLAGARGHLPMCGPTTLRTNSSLPVLILKLYF